MSLTLGSLLIERRIITKKDLDKALGIQKEKGGLIEEVLVDLGLTNEKEIAQALTAQYGFPYLPLVNYKIKPELVKSVPKNVCLQYCVIPVDKIGDNLTLAMSNPLNKEAIEDVEEITKCDVRILITTTSDVRNALSKYYK